jgi:hypothetical protein
VLGFIDLLRAGESRAFNRSAITALLQSALGTPGAHDSGPESVAEVVGHVGDRLARGDVTAAAMTDALLRLRLDPELAGLWSALGRAATLLPDFRAASREMRAIDPEGPLHLHDALFGDPLNTAAARLLGGRGDIKVVVLGHTHTVGGSVEPIAAGKRSGWYANSGSWIAAASVADLRARGVGWDRLTLADRTMFPAKNVAVTIEYAGGVPRKPALVTAPPPAAAPSPAAAH